MIDLLFPKICQGCETVLHQAEEVLCIFCQSQLAVIAHHRSGDPRMKMLFYGRLRLHYATALLRFEKKGITQALLHRLKYKGQQQIGSYFGKWLGSELAGSKEYAKIDLVVPVPLHPRKKRKRGYNQVDRFGSQIASALGAAYCPRLLKRRGQKRTQVFRSRSSRIMDESTFQLNTTDTLSGKHVLLVDDLITTGMTAELCGRTIWQLKPASLSLATIAIAS